jgi:hypothetical protein
MRKVLYVGAIAVAAACTAVAPAMAAASTTSQTQATPAAPAASWVLYESHVSGTQCFNDGQWLKAHVSGIFNTWCDASDNHANDGLYALWAYQ